MKKLIAMLLSLCLLLVCGTPVFAANDAAAGTLSVGDTMVFGQYEQDNNLSNGPEDIEWLVLDVQDDQILLISQYLLDCKPYQESLADTTWETCSLREWLNDEFLTTAFTEKEQAAIIEETVTADENPSYDTDPGEETTDKIFLLSVLEADEYFDSKKERTATATDYAVAQGAEGTAEDWWWLRTPGSSQQYAAIVTETGGINNNGCMVCGNEKNSSGDTFNNQVSVRPALWLAVEEDDLSASEDSDIVEEYDEDGELVHREEPYYVDGVLAGTLCYDAEIMCYFTNEKYNTPTMWILPVLGPDEPVEGCLSFTLNLMYFAMDDPKGLGLQVVYCRENGVFTRAGYLDTPELFDLGTLDFEFAKPTKIDGFAVMAYTPSQSGSFSVLCYMTDVYYVK